MSTQTTLFAPVGVDTAPEKSRPLLEKIQRSFKFLPNLFGVFANSPVLRDGYLAMEGAFDKGSLSAVERSIILLAASVENSYRYCTAAHSTVLKAFLHAWPEFDSAIRSNLPLPDPKLNSLVVLTREIVAERGHVRARSATIRITFPGLNSIRHFGLKAGLSRLPAAGQVAHRGEQMKLAMRRLNNRVRTQMNTTAPFTRAPA